MRKALVVAFAVALGLGLGGLSGCGSKETEPTVIKAEGQGRGAPKKAPTP